MPAERRRRLAILQHKVAGGWPRVPNEIVPDKALTGDDVAIADRLLTAFRAAADQSASRISQREDIWTLIAAHQGTFRSLLRTGSAEQLAAYLCNVSRRDASIGITQGNAEYDRIVRDPSYRRFVATMAKDKLVSLAEAIGTVPVENPEQGVYGRAIQLPPDELVAAISDKLGISIEPPDIDGGMLKLRTSRGLFGERDANAIFTAWLLLRLTDSGVVPRICEIGAGSGRVAYWRRQLGPNEYTIVDLPHVNVVQGYYLLKTAPGDRVRLYGEEDGSDGGRAPEVTIWPNHALAELPRANFDLVLNQDSMPEMSGPTVDHYLDWICKVCAGRFVSVNHESKPTYGKNLMHVSVSETAQAYDGLKLCDRYPYWLRKGYVVETYDVCQP
jgi:hypothetical protein